MYHHVTRLLMAAALIPSAFALQTENLNLNIPRSEKPKVIDGQFDDWALQDGVFCCDNVFTMRDSYATWLHASFDDKYLYILSRWTDGSPLNNAGSSAGDYGFQGDSLQFRIVTQIDKPGQARTAHLMGWRDRNGKDVIDVAYGKDFNEGSIRDAKEKGAKQAFKVYDDKSGYTQEIAIPWDLLTKDGFVPKAGDSILFTFEPNFRTDAGIRLSTKDVFKSGVVIDRVFTFQGPGSWGYGKLVEKPGADARDLRLADMRELEAKMVDGKPVIDWSPLYVKIEAPGVIPLTFTMKEDGYVSLNIFDKSGAVVRQLLTNNFFAKGEHTVKWDGLTSPTDKLPGVALKPGSYDWKALTHKGIGIRLVGWADNQGKSPFDSPGGNWGGDHGITSAVATEDKSLFLGWSGSEAGMSVVCTDLDGTVKWRQKNGGFGSAHHLAVENGVLYVVDQTEKTNTVYRLETTLGNYKPWKNDANPPSGVLDISPLLKPFAPKDAGVGGKTTGVAVAKGILMVAYGEGNRVVAIDAETGAKLADCEIAAPGDLEFGPDGRCYVISAGKQVIAVDAKLTTSTVIVDTLNNASGLAIGKDGRMYVGTLDPDNQVLVFSATGKQERTIGSKGGRPMLGAWKSEGLRFIKGLVADDAGKLWVAEYDDRPKRFSRWDAASGKLEKEFFGPTSYGATGGAINPADPQNMVGSGCEWQLDAKTGKSTCLAVISRGKFNTTRFGQSKDGRVFIATSGDFMGSHPVEMFERLAPGKWKKRTVLSPGKGSVKVWADRNDDEQEQDGEVASYTKNNLKGWISGWYLTMAQDLSYSGGVYHIAPVGFTACGAPAYDIDAATPLPHPEDVSKRGGMGMQRGHASDGGKLVLYNGYYGEAHSDFLCYDAKSGKLIWSYANTHVGIHGGHKAPPGKAGLIRAAYGPVGTATLPAPIGQVFIIATDKGEWHMLNEEGFYITHLFETDVSRIQWPSEAVPGCNMDSVPAGMGTEDFGGSTTLAKDGSLYLQHGKTAFINSKVVGLDGVKVLAKGSFQLKQEHMEAVAAIRAVLLQDMVGVKKIGAPKKTIAFSGDIEKDFGKAAVMQYEKGGPTQVRSAIAYDDTSIYLSYEVRDTSPWINGAKNFERLYAAGDTVDFQLGTDPKADGKRKDPVLGDFRLSIGNFLGKPTAVIYRDKSTKKQPGRFFSGVIRDGYEMEYVGVVPEAEIVVKVERDNYKVFAKIPQQALGLQLASGMELKGDFGATHSDQTGEDTVLRTHWNNQSTGLVADEVFELKMEPGNWGQIIFE